jgi:hypothetical protein
MSKPKSMPASRPKRRTEVLGNARFYRLHWSTAERASPFKPEALNRVDFNLSINIHANKRDVSYPLLIKM